MKIKRLPEDFQVEELTDSLWGGGPYAVYRLTKRSLGTPEAIDEIARRWKTQRRRISYGGLKDKHARTIQYVSILHGARRNLSANNFELEYVGQRDQPFTPQDIASNRFKLVIRDLSNQALERALRALPEVQSAGLPNYFDDQRFGSVGVSDEFIARSWCLGDYERALWLALAEPHPDDRGDERQQKQILRDHWGRWVECKAALERSHRRSIVTYLADKPPDRPDYRGAFSRIKVDLRGLYLSAFQSHLWNRMLDKFLRSELPADRLVDVPLRMGPAPFFAELDGDTSQRLQATNLPLPSSRLHLDSGPMFDLICGVLAEFGMEMRQLRVKYPRDSFFSKGERAAAIPIRGLTCEMASDELYAGRKKMLLNFELPRGSYATVLVKRLFDVGAETPESTDTRHTPAEGAHPEAEADSAATASDQ
ncbi:MAG: tRNA pseudouridine(13) synthase TruD [Planctomycetes bacterium]|nr:tRNA pseudouridine(13) synthase TruD [Planctomycetota bacterium]